MGLRFPEQIYGQCFFITTTFKNWQKFGDISGMYNQLAKSLTFCAKKYDARLAGYVFMPSHIHLIIFVEGQRLSSFMRDFKKFIAQKAAKDLGIRSSGIWMSRYDRVVITSQDVLVTKLQYIHDNPVKARLVDSSAEWPWSIALDYEGQASSAGVPIFRDWV